jgi:hypothetical protein
MSIRLYEAYKQLFNDTKPIRGRSVEVRPWGDRRRDWEQVICRVQDDGQCAYGARMHNTDVLLVYPNGDLLYKNDGWDTPTTAEFMGNLVLGIRVFKRYNRLWVSRDVGTEKFCALLNKPVLIKWDTTNPNYEHYRLAEPSVAQQEVIDPIKVKEERLKIKPFKDYVSNVLKISDGYVSNDLVAQYIENMGRYWEENTNLSGQIFHRRELRNLDFNNRQEAALLDAMQTEDPDEQLELFPHLLVMFVRGMDGNNGKYDPKKVAAKIDRVITKYCDVHKYHEVVITKPLTNIK